MGILVYEVFVILSTTNMLKCYIPGKLILGHDIIIPIKYNMDCKLICQKNQAQINKGNNRESMKILDYDYKVCDKIMLINRSAYKYKTPFKGLNSIIKICTNGRVVLEIGSTRVVLTCV